MKAATRSSKKDRTQRRDEAPVRYRVDPADPKGHYFDVTCEVRRPDPDGQHVALPAWIPGSYMIREFARNIVSIEATCDRSPVALVKLDKHRWRASPCDGPLTLRYRVYAWDPSVRAAHLDEGHGFFNGTSVFLRVEGSEAATHVVELVPPRGAAFRAWRVATSLRELDAPRHGFGTYAAANYDELIDHPVEMGTFLLEPFEAAGVPHEIAFTGVVPNLDAARIREDLARLCAAQIAFFERDPTGGGRAPFDRYVFLTAVATDGYGGLEHRASTALLCSRDALPVVGATDRSDGYRTFLGLVSHEYFHAWNVKRIKPAVFAPYDLARENYTSLLWIFEGFTSYYDDLFLVRTGLIDEARYLSDLAKTIDAVLTGAGRLKQSIAESSFDAWVKYYRGDENTTNAVVSYYKKGSLVALCLDLTIRLRSAGKASLDDVMRLMWSRYGRDFYPAGEGGVAEDQFPSLVREATGVDVGDEVRRWAYSTAELPLAELLASYGVELRSDEARATPALGAKVGGPAGECRIERVDEGGAAVRAGLSAGDLLVAIDGLRVTVARLDSLLAKYRPGASLSVVAFRGDVMQTRTVVLDPPARRTMLVAMKKAPRGTHGARRAWLGS